MFEEVNVLLFSAMALLFALHFFFELLISLRLITMREHDVNPPVGRFYLVFAFCVLLTMLLLFRLFQVDALVVVFFAAFIGFSDSQDRSARG